MILIGLSDCSWTQTYNHLVHKRTLNHLAKLAKWLSCVVSNYLYRAFDCMFLSCHVRISEWIHIYSLLDVKELLAQSRREVWSSSDCNWTRTRNHLAHKRTLNRLAKLAIWLSCVVSTYLYGAFNRRFLSCYVHVSEWTRTLWITLCGSHYVNPHSSPVAVT